MIESDKDNFKELMVGVGELYGKEMTKPLLRIYFGALEDYTVDQISRALTAHVKSTSKAGTFFPKPADIIRQLEGSPEDQTKNLEDRAELAWGCIEGEIRRIGSYGSLDIGDKQALAAVKAIGGWQRLCMSTYEELVWRKKEFTNAYECYDRTPIDALPSKLPGLVELSEHKQKESGVLEFLLQRAEDHKVKEDD